MRLFPQFAPLVSSCFKMKSLRVEQGILCVEFLPVNIACIINATLKLPTTHPQTCHPDKGRVASAAQSYFLKVFEEILWLY